MLFYLSGARLYALKAYRPKIIPSKKDITQKMGLRPSLSFLLGIIFLSVASGNRKPKQNQVRDLVKNF